MWYDVIMMTREDRERLLNKDYTGPMELYDAWKDTPQGESFLEKSMLDGESMQRLWHDPDGWDYSSDEDDAFKPSSPQKPAGAQSSTRRLRLSFTAFKPGTQPRGRKQREIPVCDLRSGNKSPPRDTNPGSSHHVNAPWVAFLPIA